jgi:TonB family protein
VPKRNVPIHQPAWNRTKVGERPRPECEHDLSRSSFLLGFGQQSATIRAFYMRFVFRLRVVAVWALILLVFQSVSGQSEPKDAKAEKESAHKAHSNLYVLSDTQGVNFGPYLSKAVHVVRTNWYHQIPDIARRPQLAKGEVSIEFSILPDGKIADMRVAQSSGKEALDRAAWSGIADSNPLEPLPKEFHGAQLALRFVFAYNP